MLIKIRRFIFTNMATIGVLALQPDGADKSVVLGYTLERPDEAQNNAQAPFCIPEGTYKVLLQKSPRFGFVTPHLQDVPGRTMIEIHPGNFPKDTEGCILVGESYGLNYLNNSKVVFNNLMSKLNLCINEDINAEIGSNVNK